MRQFSNWAVTGSIVILMVAASLFSVSQAALADDDDDDVEVETVVDFVPDEVVIKLFPGNNLAAIAAEFQLNPTPLGQFGTRKIYRMQILNGASPVDRAEALLADGRVEFAEPNFIIKPPEWRSRYSWARFDEQTQGGTIWAPGKLRLAEAHQVSTGAGVTVAVLDTGVDATHPDLAGRVVPGHDFVDFDNDPSEVGGYTDATPAYGHGTHVAGLVALAAPDARIMPVRVLDPEGNGNVWVLAESILYAVDPDDDPATPDGAHIINLSLSTLRPTDLLEDIIEEVTCDEEDDDDDDDRDDDDCGDGTGRGAVVVAAAGNSGTDVPEYPAAEDAYGLLAVASSTMDDRLAETSSFGSWVDVAAPGVGIVSAMPQGQYATWSGTSMASALAAGQAALVRAAYPDMTTVDVVKRIVDTAAPISGNVPRRIDAAASVTAPR